MGKKNKKIIGICLILIVINSCLFETTFRFEKIDAKDPFFTLFYKTLNTKFGINYGLLLKQNLARIGINVVIEILNESKFHDEVFIENDFDITYLELSKPIFDPDWSNFYSENGSLNLSGYYSSMDYDEELGTGKNEWMLNELKNIYPFNSQERINHFWEWQNYLMKEIVPMLPLSVPLGKVAYFNNLKG
jgi:ABC-type transport system substrate-binding protein